MSKQIIMLAIVTIGTLFMCVIEYLQSNEMWIIWSCLCALGIAALALFLVRRKRD